MAFQAQRHEGRARKGATPGASVTNGQKASRNADALRSRLRRRKGHGSRPPAHAREHVPMTRVESVARPGKLTRLPGADASAREFSHELDLASIASMTLANQPARGHAVRLDHASEHAPTRSHLRGTSSSSRHRASRSTASAVPLSARPCRALRANLHRASPAHDGPRRQSRGAADLRGVRQALPGGEHHRHEAR